MPFQHCSVIIKNHYESQCRWLLRRSFPRVRCRHFLVVPRRDELNMARSWTSQLTKKRSPISKNKYNWSVIRQPAAFSNELTVTSSPQKLTCVENPSVLQRCFWILRLSSHALFYLPSKALIIQALAGTKSATFSWMQSCDEAVAAESTLRTGKESSAGSVSGGMHASRTKNLVLFWKGDQKTTSLPSLIFMRTLVWAGRFLVRFPYVAPGATPPGPLKNSFYSWYLRRNEVSD